MAHLTALLLLWAPAAAAVAQAQYGRIDVYSANGDFNVRDVRVSPGAQKMDVGWRGKDKALTGATAQARVSAGWREIWIEVVPEADGKLQLSFQGESYPKQTADDVRRVWVDDIRVSGAAVVNGDLEELDPQGLPRGWSWSHRAASEVVSRDGSVAASGKVCVAVWHGCQLRQLLDVRRGEPVRVTARFRALATEEESRETARHGAQFETVLETRPQSVTVQFASPAAAGRALLRPLPLYNGAAWAITSRWDDNNAAHLKMRQVLLAHGYRGTFFVNDPARDYPGSHYGLLGDHPRSEIGRMLLGDGITLGGHSLTHPMLSFLNRNRIFEEALGCRIALEAAFDALVNAYAFSFGNFSTDFDGLEGHRDVAAVLARAGYIQSPQPRFTNDGCWPLGWAAVLPPDGLPIDEAFAGFLGDESLHASNPAISFSMHTWYRTPAAWAKFEAQLDQYGRRPEWWYCNQNEYGAYRAQYACASRAQPARQHATLSLVFDRPVLIDLNDPIPLTFEISGVRPDEVVRIDAGGAHVERVAAQQGAVRLELHHSSGAQLPKRIDHLATDRQELVKSAKFPGVEGRLSFDGTKVHLQVRNTSATPLRQLRVVYRLPPLAETGIVRRERFDLAPGQTHSDVLPVGSVRSDARYRAGAYYAAAQLDFLHDEAAGRIYLSTHTPGTWDDASYPNHGFLVLGPIPRKDVDFAAISAAQVRSSGWVSADGRKLTFAPVDPAIAEVLSVEVIGVRGKWSNKDLDPCAYLLASTVNSPRPRDIEFVCSRTTVPAIWLDGRRVQRTAALKAGANQLLLAYEPPVARRYAPDHAGAALRIVDAHTGRRLEDVKYQP